MKILADIKGLGEIVETYDNFYSELKQLKEARAKLITPRNEAYARLQTKGKEDIGKECGTRTTAGFEYAKNQLPIFRINSRLTNPGLAKQVVEANKLGNYFCTNSTEEYKELLKQAGKDKNKEPIKRTVIVLPSRDNFTISDKENWDIYEMALKDQAKPYFELNGPITINLVDKKTVDSQNGTLLTNLWFGWLDGRSGFDGNWGLGNDDRARGVRKKIGEATQKISKDLPYTQRDVNKSLKILNEIKQGKIKVCDLESRVKEIAEFLARLKQ